MYVTRKKCFDILYIYIKHKKLVGAGCGVGVFSHFSVATENTKMSMPETRFGHFCDAGSSFYLSRLNGHMGRYIALCSKTLVAEDTL